MVRRLLRTAPALALALSFVSVPGTVAIASSCDWQTQTLPARASDTHLYGVAMSSSTDVWAVGFTSTTRAGLVRMNTFIEHWNGIAWHRVSSPDRGIHGSSLDAIAAISPTDAWAAGYHLTSFGAERPLLEHWDGMAWSVVQAPSIHGNTTLYSVAAVASDDVWVVGSHTVTHGGRQPVILHWNGSTWTTVASPTLSGEGGDLNGVAMADASYGWAVGSDVNKPVIEHWDGTRWTIAKEPSGDPGYLQGISSTHSWAVGSGLTNGDPLIEHWDGTRWSVVASPPAFDLEGASAASKTDVWAVGYNYTSLFVPLIEHWDGSSWTVDTSTPDEGGLFGVAADPATGQAWAVGSVWDSSTLTDHALVLYHC